MGIYKIDSISSFCTHKRGETDSDIQDYIGINNEKQRFALSDGVTNSVLPQLWAQLLVEDYLNVESADDFPSPNLPSIFLEKKNNAKEFMTEDQLFMLDLAEEEFVTSAATFAGISIGDDILSWKVIGDSCIFILFENGEIKCISSNKNSIGENGIIQMVFNNHPDVLRSDGTIKGKWISESIGIEPAWIVIMSDRMSEWFVSQYNQEHDPVNLLRSIRDDDHFENFVDNEYKAQRLKSDDESVILIHIAGILDNNESNEKERRHTKESDETNIFYRIISRFLDFFSRKGNTEY